MFREYKCPITTDSTFVKTQVLSTGNSYLEYKIGEIGDVLGKLEHVHMRMPGLLTLSNRLVSLHSILLTKCPS